MNGFVARKKAISIELQHILEYMKTQLTPFLSAMNG